jgi:hypothetical protein
MSPAPKGTYKGCSILPSTLLDIKFLQQRMFAPARIKKTPKAKRPPEWARSIPGLLKYLVERELARYKDKSLPF